MPYDFDEFILHYMSFLYGEYPDGKKVRGNNSIQKAFEYAAANDIWSAPNGFYGCKETPSIYPQYTDFLL